MVFYYPYNNTKFKDTLFVALNENIKYNETSLRSSGVTS